MLTSILKENEQDDSLYAFKFLTPIQSSASSFSKDPTQQPFLAVSCQHLFKSFNSVHALNDVNLDVFYGELLMLVGPSGCGKTTLISVIAGILHPDEGQCTVFDYVYPLQNWQKYEKALLDFRSKNIGFIFQGYHLIPSLSVLDNVCVPLLIQGMKTKEAKEMALEGLKNVGLENKENQKPAQLSGGEQQRVAISRALIHRPRLLICDEPTSALDHYTGIKIIELIKDLNKKLSMTVIIVTHDARIFELADRLAYMDDGKIKRVESKISKDQTGNI
jgi:putative ABC transport system ATP-binding protein